MPPDPLAAARQHRVRVGVGASVVLVLLALGIAVLVSAMSAAGGSHTVIEAPGVGSIPGDRSDADGEFLEAPTAAVIFVHILGEVRRPGLVQLREGDRVIDALAAAGGYTDAADRAYLNLARFVSDGEQLIIFVQGEAPDVVAGGGSASGGVSNGKVNLNLADSTALETLPRVGPALAARILQWREANGRFRSIEDLMSVTGIGEKTFAGLRDLVTV